MQVDNVTFERQPIADHANQLAANVQGNLKRSLEALGVVTPCSLHHAAGMELFNSFAMLQLAISEICSWHQRHQPRKRPADSWSLRLQ